MLPEFKHFYPKSSILKLNSMIRDGARCLKIQWGGRSWEIVDIFLVGFPVKRLIN
jgi:hypothetical protein